MEVQLYNTVSDMKQLQKTINPIKTVNAHLLDDNISILNPRLILETTPENIINCNYAYIPKWKRYYYVGDYTVDTAGCVIVPLSIDVLMSHRTEILQLDVIASRSSNKYNLNLTDNLIPILNNPFIITKRMSYNLFSPDTLNNDSDCFCVNILSAEGV